MPKKIVKTHGGTVWEIKSILLPNGNLLIPKRTEANRDWVDWTEVAPGTSDYKRWYPVREIEPDPRNTAEYKAWKEKYHR